MSTQTSSIRTVIAATAILAAVLIAAGLARAVQQADPKPTEKAASADQTPKEPSGNGAAPDYESLDAMGQALDAALRNSPGCLGLENATTESGKEVIFAWFENKKAVLTWYDSPMHKVLAGTYFKNRGDDYKPLAKVPDDAGPILVIASISLSEKQEVDGVEMPISQIAIELYQPLPGGLSINGTFTPEKVKVPGRRDSGRPRAAGAASRPAVDGERR